MQDLHGFSLFGDHPAPPAETLSKKGFAELIGVSPGRVSQLIAAGLPVEPNGRIHIARGKAWVAENVDPNRRRASLDAPSPAHLSPRAMRDAAEAEIARLKAERMGRQLIDRAATLRTIEARARFERDAWLGWVNRAATLRTIEARARFERDAWLGWVNRAAPEIASTAGADLAVVVGVLDRLVRAQLVTLADMPLEDIPHD
ncbi:hypothetical protein [Ancylobacter oerskovii]|uniref:DNA-binding protein n=1 Tax=Ancylobacter oerskovii TaxID=459519 RepID=A0ABW4YVN6_9HYPH|nr:hypothetical protein [Ancylobacter oerskovii]MBS7544357.1 hypothetical protein [Ancylobacter oerskovii]